MLVSLCTPCMNRLDDLLATLPVKLASANACPPVEIAIVDYNSTDGLQDALRDLMHNIYLADGNFFTYRKYTGRDTYHAAHANNLAMLLGSGEYVVLTPADVYIELGYLPALREQIAAGAVWANTTHKRRSTIAISKAEFIACGGYDERFEMYGPDDLDLIERLERRGAPRGAIPDECVRDIYTPPEKKVANYRVKLSHGQLGKLSMPYLHENRAAGQLVANAGVEWGQWA